MNIGIYQSAASLSALERWQDSVTQNIASSQLPGYRKRTVDFGAQTAGQLQTGSVSQQSADTAQPSVFPTASNSINFLPGEAQPTGRELDVAIQGEGFFEVQAADGSHAYTRNGAFEIQPDSTLTTSSGEKVLNESGSPITLLPGGGPLVINPDGSLMQNGASLGKIAVQKFADNAALTPGPDGTFVPAAGTAATPVEKPDVLQGYLESSNVSSMHEMVDLITISRAYESNQKMISTVDQEMQKTLDALG